MGIGIIVVAVLGTLWRSAIERNRSIPDEPFRIAGNLYYVGHTGMAAFLVTGPEGHVLIDGGYPEHGPLIEQSVADLRFDIRDVRVLLNSHAHSDHAGGLKHLQDVSGAELWVSEGDAEVMAAGGAGDRALGPARFAYYIGGLRFDAPRIDHVFGDGEVIRVGPLELTAHITAGHTRGCTSWSFPVQHEERELLAVSICSLTLFPFVSVVDRETYPGIRNDFESSFRTLRDLPADLF
ncbi:MAG: metallo-beta-lactamase, partial [Gemmatimonadetes bacterium]|nr:metallo-beta-lactamase [Gemmatimonadota bacterium]